LGERFRLTTPSWSEVAWAYDKRSTYQLAATLNLDYPWTFTHAIGMSEALDCTYPVILKPAVKENAIASRPRGLGEWRIARNF
jgi:predicted ATP-grasp superfamily ATP-dependent carboligase